MSEYYHMPLQINTALQTLNTPLPLPLSYFDDEVLMKPAP